MKELELFVTLWPSDKIFPHYEKFASDERIAGVRLNTALLYNEERRNEKPIEELFDEAVKKAHGTRVYCDIKGRQLRVCEVSDRKDKLELTVNHDINVNLPTVAIFKGGNDPARLAEIKDKRTLVFDAGPKWKVKTGESVSIRDPSLKVQGTIPEYEKEVIKKARNAVIKDFMLSFVENEEDMTELRKYTGSDGELVAKIESKDGLDFVRYEYNKDSGYNLMTARGDLFVTIKKPHQIVKATEDIVKACPNAIAASRILLSVTNEPVPSCSDFSDLEFLLKAGYTRLMLCDGLCMKPDSLDIAINIIEAYAKDRGYKLVKKFSPPKEETTLNSKPVETPVSKPIETPGWLGKIFYKK
ncbi:hypothetical protein HZA97_04490 [Candidatus Woesearchaeota archaeon]|nr:hypothetical protein [Candidatus Woesearchaeota archaeon]